MGRGLGWQDGSLEGSGTSYCLTKELILYLPESHGMLHRKERVMHCAVLWEASLWRVKYVCSPPGSDSVRAQARKQQREC
jgi:hypothetical protein